MGLNFLTTAPQGAFLFIYKTMSATAKYQLGDSVRKKRNTAGGVSLEIAPAVGQVISQREKRNKKGTPCIYCTVRWKDGRSSEHAQHMLVPFETRPSC